MESSSSNDVHDAAAYEEKAHNEQSRTYIQAPMHSKKREQQGRNAADDTSVSVVVQSVESGEKQSNGATATGGDGPPKKKSVMAMASSKALRPFVIISSSYLLFTITDGAIRMIVLLHAYTKNFSALEVAIMFTLYELAGVVTNLVRTYRTVV